VSIGAEIIAPNGFGQLRQGVPHHFLTNDPKTSRVVLVRFNWIGKGHPSAHLISMPRDEFESGLSRSSIVPVASQTTLPPWLKSLQGVNLAALDAQRLNAKQTHLQRIESRLMLIMPALENLPSILSAEAIEGEINTYARRTKPQQNESRFRLWFLTYLCFGQNIWALLPPFHLAGRWDREIKTRKKQGAPSKAFGREYGHRINRELAERCVKAYSKFNALGITMSKLYAIAMLKEFGCKTLTGPSGMLEYYNPEGNPFPSERQFRYHIGKLLGIQNVQKNRYGSARHRRQLSSIKGKFSADVSNLMEKVEADGYYTSEKPRGYIEGSVLPPLCVVTVRDMLSGMKLGIGFSFGKESGTAYKMMLFSMAVPKEYFCKLWAVQLEPGDWPSEGLSPHLKVDRGPGASQSLIEIKAARPTIRNIAPSWSGQSKATVESSHPRDVKFEGEPSYIASQLTPVELAKREIYALILYNQSANMSARMGIDRELAFTAPTPLALWRHYDARLRHSGWPMSIDDAVRAFLTPIRLTAKKDGIYLEDRLFHSLELRECGLLDRIARGNETEVFVQGYMLDLCIRHVWAEVDGKILLLDAQLIIREDDELLSISFAELKQWKEARATVNSAFTVHQSAATSEFRGRFERDTKKTWDAGSRKPGRAKRNAVARQEESEARQHTSKRKSA
jgi:hypothetical protein